MNIHESNGQAEPTDQEIKTLLKESIKLENEKRKINRPSWKTEYENERIESDYYRKMAYIGLVGWIGFAGVVIAHIILHFS